MYGDDWLFRGGVDGLESFAVEAFGELAIDEPWEIAVSMGRQMKGFR